MRWWDIPAAVELERAAFGADGWSAPLFWSELARPASRAFLVAEEREAVVGYAGLAVGPDEAHVQTIGVRRECWRTGIGSALLAELLVRAGDRPVLLEVRADNVRARALYVRYGFRELGRRTGYYQPSGADALVMRRG